jgi:hypothetical protein
MMKMGRYVPLILDNLASRRDDCPRRIRTIRRPSGETSPNAAFERNEPDLGRFPERSQSRPKSLRVQGFDAVSHSAAVLLLSGELAPVRNEPKAARVRRRPSGPRRAEQIQAQIVWPILPTGPGSSEATIGGPVRRDVSPTPHMGLPILRSGQFDLSTDRDSRFTRENA